jgi:hypothetical protein
VLVRLRPVAGPLSFSGPFDCGLVNCVTRALGLDPRERIHRIRLIPTEASRQQAPQQLGRCPASGDGTGFVILIVDLSPARRRLPGLR